MKFGFMSMSLTYFSSLNMIRCYACHWSTGDNSSREACCWSNGYDCASRSTWRSRRRALTNLHRRLRGHRCQVRKKRIQGLGLLRMLENGLASLALGQYRENFADAAVDGAFLLDLNDESK